MTDRGDLRFDDEGFVDMDAFQASDPEEVLDPATYARLREVLAEAPVPVPGPQRLDEWIERAVAQPSEAGDTASLVPGPAPGDEPLEDPPFASDGDPAPWHELGAPRDPDIDVDFEDAPEETDEI